jgi:hypothetical protein
MVTALDPLREAQSTEKCAEVIKSDACIRRTSQYTRQNRITHVSLCARGRLDGIAAKCTGLVRLMGT